MIPQRHDHSKVLLPMDVGEQRMDQRRHPLTLPGLDAAMRKLSR